MASAKERFYKNQAKKGKITRQQASSAVSGRGLSSYKPKKSSDNRGSIVSAKNLTDAFKSGGLTADYVPNKPSAKYYGPSLPGKVKEGYYNPYSGESKLYEAAKESKEKKDSSNREKAKKVYNEPAKSDKGEFVRSLLGVPAASAGDKVVSTRPTPTTAGNIINKLSSPGRSISELITGRPQPKPTDYLDSLGLSRILVKDTPYLEAKLDEGIGFDPKGFVTGTTPEQQSSMFEYDRKMMTPYESSPTDEELNARISSGDFSPKRTQRTAPENIMTDTKEIDYNAPVQGTFEEQMSQYEKMLADLNTQEQQILAENPDLAQRVEDYTPIQQDLGGTARKLASSGVFGNGAGISNYGNFDPATQEYIKLLRKSGGDSKEAKNWMKDQTSSIDEQIKSLIDSLTPQYDEQQRLATNTLNQAKIEDQNKLASIFGVYNTGDSEQRMQTQERTQSDYQNRLAELLARLNASKQQDIAGYRQKGLGMRQDVANKYQDMLQQIQEQKRLAQEKVAQLIYQTQQDSYNRENKLALSNKQKNMSLSPIGYDEYGKPNKWLDQSTGNVLSF